MKASMYVEKNLVFGTIISWGIELRKPALI